MSLINLQVKSIVLWQNFSPFYKMAIFWRLKSWNVVDNGDVQGKMFVESGRVLSDVGRPQILFRDYGSPESIWNRLILVSCWYRIDKRLVIWEKEPLEINSGLWLIMGPERNKTDSFSYFLLSGHIRTRAWRTMRQTFSPRFSNSFI